ncbi:hypothetical protein TBR22_A26590 [Luteitalea sp. TBR-22]|uniref:hypothetical protein n=1 Tax=Luteitalea sp. TBR-22 TaxID=2802971 RepID=UPI001AFB4B70|nr:hypothetical protein [Luteitalea sp. TBR-22]BCS33432.1 hypothetical protein TBR22_A26590 [Luteitalea sp. TBR-22]
MVRVVALCAFILAACSPAPEAPPDTGWRVGASSRSVLPTVDGGTGYASPERLPPDADADDPGVFAAQFDQGPLTVGNGRDNAHWVRDDLRVRALAMQRSDADRVVVIVSADVYMVFRPDAEELRRMVREVLPEARKDRVEVLVHATHNHHGPDTAFAVNPEWYRLFLEQARDAVREAIERLEPATLRVAEGVHYFGGSDLGGLRVYDPTLGVLQARATDGRVIATLVNWANHPESTLNWSPPRERIAAACRTLAWADAACDAQGRYLTADYPGALARWLGRRVGGEVVYVNGAVGAMASPLDVPVWEVNERAPIGDGYTPPPAAVPPGSVGKDFKVRNFRKAILIGEQLGAAVEGLLRDAGPLAPGPLTVTHQAFFTRMSNIGFRKLAVVDPQSGRAALGFKPGELFSCPATGPKTAATCVDDKRAVETDPVVGPIRKGDHTRTAVSLLRIGEVTMAFLPGEVPGELVMGLPRAIKATPRRWADETPEHHVAPDRIGIPGYVKRMLPGTHKWAVGLGNDELGYILPLDNYRVLCVADKLAGPGTCARLHAAGLIDFPDAVAGARCKALVEDPAAAASLPDAAREAVLGSCRYGQAMGRPAGHYEETNSVGWDAAADMIAAVAAVTGKDDRTQVNEKFAGYHHRFPPPRP